MSINPILTFKAGMCELDDSSKPYKVNPQPVPGFIYLYKEDDIPHFCWRPRSAPLNDATIDLIMFPGDGAFAPYEPKSSGSESKSATNGRVYVLKFSSSSSRHLFWLQSKSQHPSGDASWFSPRDLKLGEIVNAVLQGEEVDVQQEIANLPSNGPGGDDDTTMEDVDGPQSGSDLHRAASGGAGAGATGGDIREEGEESREGGADGGRAAAPPQTEAEAAVANFLKSLQGNKNIGGARGTQGKAFTTLSDLLDRSHTLPILNDADESYLDGLLSQLPPTLILLSSGGEDASMGDPDPETVQAVMMSLSIEQKKEILSKVLRSPQFSQSLESLTMALREGGLPTISEALKINVTNRGLVPGGTVPLGAGEAVEAFLNGVKKEIEEETKHEGQMETD